MNKKLLGIVAAAAIFAGAHSSSVSAMAIPSHSLVIGNKAYSIDYVVKPANYGEINYQILSASNVYYVVNSSTVKELFSNTNVSTSVIDSIPSITYKDKYGDQYVARSGASTLEHVQSPLEALANIQTLVGYYKRITVASTNIPNAGYFKVTDGVNESSIGRVGNSVTTNITGNNASIYFYSDSSGNYLTAVGTLNVADLTGTTPKDVSDVNYAVGNTSGNLSNLGLVASDINNQWVYYRGTGGNLFKVKNDGVDRTQLTVAHNVEYINVVGDQVYYVHTNPATKTSAATTGVYRMKVDGSDAVPIMSGTKQVGTMGNLVTSNYDGMKDVTVAGNYIYYISSSDGSIHKASLNGSSDVVVRSNQYADMNIVKNNIYVINESDHNKIYKIDMDTFASTKVSDVQAKHLNVVDNYMYYRNYTDNEKLYRMSIDGVENKKLCDDMVFNLNVCGDTVYYKNHSDGDKLYKIGIDGTGGQQVLTPVFLNKGTKISNDVVEYVNAIDPNVYFAPAKITSVTSIAKDGTGRAVMK